jgi:hypothetical protein
LFSWTVTNLIDEFVLADPFTVGFREAVERFQTTEYRGPRLYPVPTSLSRAALGALAMILNGHGSRPRYGLPRQHVAPTSRRLILATLKIDGEIELTRLPMTRRCYG